MSELRDGDPNLIGAELLDALPQCAAICTAVRDPRGRILDFRIDHVNAAACAASDLMRETEIGRRLDDLFPGHRECGLFDAYCDVVDTGRPFVRDRFVHTGLFGGRVQTRSLAIRAGRRGDGIVCTWHVVEESSGPTPLEQSRDGESRYRELWDDAPDMFCSVDPTTGVVLDCNRTLLRVTGFTRDEVVGRPVLERYAPDSVDRAQRCLEQFRRTGEVRDVMLEIRRKNGEPIDISLRANAVRDTAGRIVRSRSVWRDVSAVTRVEEELRRSEERLRLAQAAADLGIHDFDPRSGRIEWDERVRRIWGIAADEPVTFARFMAAIHPDDRQAVEDAVRDAIDPAGDRRYQIQYRVVRDGHVTWVAVTGDVTFEGGQAARLIGTVKDITSRKQAEARLAESERRFRQLADSIPQLVWTADDHGVVEYYNSQAARYQGLVRQPDGNWSWQPVVHEDERAATLDAWREAVERQGQYEYEHRICMADGSYRWHLSRARRLTAGDGSGRWLGTATDVHELKEAEATLRAAKLALEAEDRKKDLFIATLGHELRNPLAALDASVTLLERGAAAAADLTPRMASQVRHLTRLVDDLLDVSRISAGKVRLQKSWTDLQAVVDAAVRDVQLSVRCKRQKLVVTGEAVSAQADATRLEQVIANLLSNACKFTPEGGQIAIHLCRDGDDALVTVRDDGRGLHPEQFESIFEPFEQLEPGPGGLGLGLVLVKTLVELHGGSVHVTSAGSGRGSTFTVRVPIGDGNSTAALQRVVRERSPGRTMRVLIVDDARDGADLLALLFGHGGAEARCAYTATDGLESFREWQPDVALVDIGLPDLPGYEFARAVRAEEDGHRALLLAVTGFGDAATEKLCLAAGFDRRLIKPVGFDALLDVITAHRDGAGA